MKQPIRQARIEKGSRRRVSGLVALSLSCALCMLAVVVSVFPLRGIVAEGKPSPQTFRAPYSFEDEEATAQARKEAVDSVKDVYRTDYSAIESAQDRLEAYLSALERMRADATTLREKEAKTNKVAAQKGDLSADEWKKVIDENEISVLRSTDAENVTDEEIYQILAVPQNEMRIWIRETLVRISKALRSGIRVGDIGKARTNAVSALTPYTPAGIVSLNTKIADRYVIETSLFDEETTQSERNVAESAVEPVMIPSETILVEQGNIVDAKTVGILKKLGFVQSTADMLIKLIVLCAVVLVCFWLFGTFLRQNTPQGGEAANSSLQAILLVLTVFVGVLTFRVNPRLNPVFLSAALFTLLIGPQTATAVSLLLTAVLGIISGGYPQFDYVSVAQTLLASAAGSLTGVLLVRKTSHRFSIITAGIASGGAMALVYAMFDLWKGLSASDLLINVLWGLGSGLTFAVASVGLLPLWEWLFDIATPARLMELGNVNNPLLKRLMLEAPGTYHHSMMVATLAEAAANAVGANAMLARVGAYYHDIGKLRRPYYFKENQRTNENPHDALEPAVSASIILAHVKDGLTYAQKAQLPDAVQRMIAEHHGTTAVTYFYHKAVLHSGDQQLPMTGFRYAGPKPSSKESAIVLLADSVEAAVRSMDSTSRDKIEEMTHKIINGKIQDGQLSSAPILFADADLIALAMIKAFSGILHERIEYPELGETKEERDD